MMMYAAAVGCGDARTDTMSSDRYGATTPEAVVLVQEVVAPMSHRKVRRG
jgi:hypothetical protein